MIKKWGNIPARSQVVCKCTLKKVNYNLYVLPLCSTFEEIELYGAFQSEILSLHSDFGL